MIVPGLTKQGCCVGGSQKLIGKNLALTANGTGEVVFDNFPGKFCIQNLFISGEPETVSILSFKVGTEELILSGEIGALIFATSAQCCPILCVDCVCMPGVPIRLHFRNEDSLAHSINVALLGCYEEDCPPERPVAEFPNRVPRTYPR